MQFLSIQKIMENQINFSQFNLTSLSNDEKRMLILNLETKVEKNEKFTKMLNTEKLKTILEIFSEDDSDIKTKISEEIKNLELLDTWMKIRESDLKIYEIIKQYYNDLVKLLKKDFDLKITNKYIIIYIQNVLMTNQYDIEDIQRIIKHIREMYEMMPKTIEEIQENEYLMEEIEVEDIKKELEIQELVEKIIKDLKIEEETKEEEETILYVNLYNIDDILKVLKIALQINYNMSDLFERLSRPYLYNNSRIKSQNLIRIIINKIIKNRNITESLKIFSLNQITSFLIKGHIEQLLNGNKMGDVITFIQLIENFNKNIKNINIMKKMLNDYKTDRLSKVDFGHTEKCIEYMKEYTEYFTKSETHSLLTEYKGLKNLKGIVEILLIGRPKISKMSKMKNPVPVQKKIINNEFNIFELIDDIKITKMITKPIVKTIKKDIDTLKNERIQLSNMLKIVKEQGNNDLEIVEKIKELDLKIKEYYINFEGDKIITENVNELIKYLQYLKNTSNNTDEIERVENKINNYSEQMRCYEDNYGTNYVEQVENKHIYATFDNNLTKIINKYTNEFNNEEKKQDKENFFQKQDRLIKQNILITLTTLDNKFNTNYKKHTSKLFNHYKKELDSDIKKGIFKNIINKKLVKGKKNHVLFNLILEISKVFATIYYINNNKKIDVSKIYETIKLIDNKNKLVLIKSLDKQGTYIEKMNNKVYVNVCEEIICVEENDIEFLNTFVNKNVKIIKGPLKGLLGRVYEEKRNTVLLTKDTYGKISKRTNPNIKTVSNLQIIRLNKDYIKLAEEQFEDESEIIYNNYRDLCNFSKLQNKGLYPLTKYSYINNNTTNYNIFNELYELSLNVFNSMKINELNEYKNILKMKNKYDDDKKVLKELKNEGKKTDYIIMRKKLKNEEQKIRKILLNLKKKNITKSILTFEKVENTSSKYIIKKVVEKPKTRKQTKKQQKINQKLLANKLIEESENQLEALMKDLLM